MKIRLAVHEDKFEYVLADCVAFVKVEGEALNTTTHRDIPASAWVTNHWKPSEISNKTRVESVQLGKTLKRLGSFQTLITLKSS